MQWLTNLLSNSKNSDREIRNIFFDLIQNNKGAITVIDFAVAADVSGTDAKKILEQFAIEFDATFDVTEQGQVVYLFPTTSKSVTRKVLSKPQTSSPIFEPKNNNESQLGNESNRAKSSFADFNNDLNRTIDEINKDVRQKVEDINNDVKRKMEDINKY